MVLIIIELIELNTVFLSQMMKTWSWIRTVRITRLTVIVAHALNNQVCVIFIPIAHMGRMKDYYAVSKRV